MKMLEEGWWSGGRKGERKDAGGIGKGMGRKRGYQLVLRGECFFGGGGEMVAREGMVDWYS